MSGRARRLPVYVGMVGVITMNRTMRHPEYVNATVGIITNIELGADGIPVILHVHVLSTPEGSPPVLLMCYYDARSPTSSCLASAIAPVGSSNSSPPQL